MPNLINNETARAPINLWPHDERPREKLLKHGSENLSNCELIAIMIRTGIGEKEGGRSALDLAKNLLYEYENLNNLMNASISELSRIKGIGFAKAAQILASIELGKRAVSEKNGTDIKFKCSEEVAGFYIPLMKDLKKEQFKEIMLDVKNKLIRDILISQGSLTASIVHPREVLKPAIQYSAASLIFLHNHPSGDPEPSGDDIEITNRLMKSCSIIGINMLDHIIIGCECYFSFKQKNLI